MEELSKELHDLTLNKDIISFLPDNIIDMILARLPLEEAMSTSLLSRYWRYKWRSMSEIIIDDNQYTSNNMEKTVIHFLLLHKGNIQKFEYTGKDAFYSYMYIWLHHLVSAYVQQLKLDLRSGLFSDDKYLLPSSVFFFHQLITLHLRNCTFKLPSSFEGFKNLTSLVLKCTKFDDGYTTPDRLIHLCPLLKHLDLSTFTDPIVLELHAPNLHSFEFEGYMKTLGFNDTPLITTVSLKLSRIVPYDLSNLLGGLSNVVDLKLFGVCTFPFQGIAYELSLEEIKFMFLKKLQLTVNLNCPQESEIVHCILRNTPSLNYLNIDMKILIVTDPPTDIFTWPEPDNISFKFRHLKIFNMDFGYGWKSEMRFIKFVLGSAPSLEESTIKCGWPSVLINVVGILRELLSFKRASSAKVNFSL